MTEVRRLALPVPYLGSVNLWLLEGEPLTLVDTGPRNTVALETLEEQLAAHGYAIGDIELLLLTHHHLDHTGLARTIRSRSDARVAASGGVAAWGRAYEERVGEERRFTERPSTRVRHVQPYLGRANSTNTTTKPHANKNSRISIRLQDGAPGGGRRLGRHYSPAPPRGLPPCRTRGRTP